MKHDITIAIITKDREKDLKECLESLTKQSIVLPEILIVNNNSLDRTSHLIKEYKKKLVIREVKEKKVGYPFARNKALQETNTKWIIFIDDDCIIPPSWFQLNIESIKNYDKTLEVAAILGESKNIYQDNVFACAFQYGHDLWKAENIEQDGTIRNYEVLDTRNIILNTKVLKEHKIFFNQSLLSGAEDSDLGVQIQNASLKAIYNKNSLVYHKEPNSLFNFLKKKFLYRKSYKKYLLSISLKKPINKIKLTKIEINCIYKDVSRKLSYYQKIVLNFLLLC